MKTNAAILWEQGAPLSVEEAELEGFVAGAMHTVLAPDELIAGLRLPKFSPAARFGYHKICRKVGEFAEAIGALAHDPERGVCRLAASTLSGAPLVLEGSAALLKTAPDPAHLEHRLDAAGFAGDAYDRRLRAVALARALAMAMARP